MWISKIFHVDLGMEDHARSMGNLGCQLYRRFSKIFHDVDRDSSMGNPPIVDFTRSQ